MRKGLATVLILCTLMDQAAQTPVVRDWQDHRANQITTYIRQVNETR